MKIKRFLAILASAAVMMLGLGSVCVQADEDTDPSIETSSHAEDIELTDDNSQPVEYVDQKGISHTIEAGEYRTVDGTPDENERLVFEGGTYVLNKDVTFVSDIEGVYIDGDTELILCDGCTFDIQSVLMLRKSKLTIYGQSEGTGTLKVHTHSDAQGLPDTDNDIASVVLTGKMSSLAINSGTVNIKASSCFAGIDTFQNSDSIVSISGGTVDIKGGNNSPAIGTAVFDNTEIIVMIDGGTVNAVSGFDDSTVNEYPGIGHGCLIHFESSRVNATVKDCTYNGKQYTKYRKLTSDTYSLSGIGLVYEVEDNETINIDSALQVTPYSSITLKLGDGCTVNISDILFINGAYLTVEGGEKGTGRLLVNQGNDHYYNHEVVPYGIIVCGYQPVFTINGGHVVTKGEGYSNTASGVELMGYQPLLFLNGGSLEASGDLKGSGIGSGIGDNITSTVHLRSGELNTSFGEEYDGDRAFPGIGVPKEKENNLYVTIENCIYNGVEFVNGEPQSESEEFSALMNTGSVFSGGNLAGIIIIILSASAVVFMLIYYYSRVRRKQNGII